MTFFLEPSSTDASHEDDTLDEDVESELEQYVVLRQPESDATFIRIFSDQDWRLQVQESDKESRQTFARAA